jgi:dTDP-4-amino-4,6-dideoxygalactose transaminase
LNSSKEYKVRFRNLAIEDPDRKSELLDVVGRVLDHGQFLMGGEVEAFEEKIAQYCSRSHCVGVSSGTDALYLSVRALNLQPGDEIITTPLSWIATLNAIHLGGGKPVFVDVGQDLNINSSLIEASITSNTKAILPVHYTGRICNMDKILGLSKKYNLRVIEDSAQAFGAHYNGRYAGSFGDMGAFSMNPMKVLSGFGEAGAIVTNNIASFEQLKALRYLGTVNKEVCIYPSLNAKIDTLQAALLICNLKYVEEVINARVKIASLYTEYLNELVICPSINSKNNRESVFFDYTILSDSRDELGLFLEKNGIETKIKHPILMYQQPAYKELFKSNCPVAESIVNQILCLPIHEKMKNDDVMYVIHKIKQFYG